MIKQYLLLEEEDIRQALANFYSTRIDYVNLKYSTTLRGYGADEHEEPCIEAVIAVPFNDQR